MISNETVAKTIAALRSSRNMTQQQFAAILGVSHQAVSKWETGSALPDLDSMLEITRLFGITMEQLLNGNIPEFEEETETEKQSVDFLTSIMGKDAADSVRRAMNNCKAFGERIGNKINEVVDNLVSDIDEEDDGTVEYEEDEAETAEDEAAADETIEEDEAADEPREEPKMSLHAIIELAPFMTAEKTTETVLACEETVTSQTLRALAPFVTPDGLEQIIAMMPEGAFTMDDLIAVAPFIKRETLFRLSAANADKLDVDSLKRLAPFLRKNMVDGLMSAMQNFTGSEFMNSVQDFTAKAGKKLGEWGVQGYEYAKDICFQVAKAAKETCDEFKNAVPVQEEKPAPDDGLREKILRAAYEAGNWEYLRGRLSSVSSPELLTAICEKATGELPYEDAVDIVMNALPYLDDGGIHAVIRRLTADGMWDLSKDAAPFADAPTAEFVMNAALEQRTDAALAAAKAYAKKASRETLSVLSDKAIAEGAWDFISAIDSAI